MLTKSDIYSIENIARSTESESSFTTSDYYTFHLLELIELMARKIWSDCGENLSDFLMPGASLDIQDANEIPENLVLQSDLSLEPITAEEQIMIMDFRKVML